MFQLIVIYVVNIIN